MDGVPVVALPIVEVQQDLGSSANLVGQLAALAVLQVVIRPTVQVQQDLGSNANLMDQLVVQTVVQVAGTQTQQGNRTGHIRMEENQREDQPA